MYWNSVSATSVNFEELLNKKDVTLQEIMDDDGVLQECKAQNMRLIEYLVRSDILEKLVQLTTEEPSGYEDDAIKYKYSNIACELLTSEVPQLSESLAKDKVLLGKLYSFLNSDAPLNPLLASFFSKTISVLITRNNEQNWYSYQFTCLNLLEFLKLKEDSISLLLKHLGTSAIMDIVCKLVTKVEGSDLREIVLNWLDEQKLVQRLVALFDPTVDADRHYNTAELLCDLIRISRIDKVEHLQQNKILDRIESSETVNLLLDYILKEPKCETSIVGGISVLLVLLDYKWTHDIRYKFDLNPRCNSDYLKIVSNITKSILPRLKDFHDILLNPPYKPSVRTTVSVLDPPLGNTRIEVAKLLSILVASNNEEINKELARLDTINVLLDLFFKYTWNNFLHTEVQKCLASAFYAECSTVHGDKDIQKNDLIAHIFSKCHLIQRILDAWEENEKQQTEHKNPRKGYMGHLIEIALTIIDRAGTDSFCALMQETVDIETLSNWENFVNTKLSDIQKTYMGVGFSESNKDGGEGKNNSFGNFSQELYSNYHQLQTLAPAFREQFGSFQENQFNDDEDVKNISTNPSFEKINFNVNEEENDQQAIFFEKVCAQKFQTLDDFNGFRKSEELDALSNNNIERGWPALENSSSDEEDEHLESSKTMSKDCLESELPMVSSWPGENKLAVSPTENTNPWESANVDVISSPDLGWANFEEASAANFGLNLNFDINTTIATSTSYEIDTIPLDLTPNESVGDINEKFCNEKVEPPSNKNNVSSDLSEDITTIAQAMDKSLSVKENESGTDKSLAEIEPKEENEKTLAVEQINSAEIPEIIGDVNSLDSINKEKELLENFRFLSSQGLMTNSDREPEGGDSYQLLKTNVQTVPIEQTQASSVQVEQRNSEDKSTNGPI